MCWVEKEREREYTLYLDVDVDIGDDDRAERCLLRDTLRVFDAILDIIIYSAKWNGCAVFLQLEYGSSGWYGLFLFLVGAL